MWHYMLSSGDQYIVAWGGMSLHFGLMLVSCIVGFFCQVYMVHRSSEAVAYPYVFDLYAR